MHKMMENEYPEVEEFVLGTVDSIFKQGAFINLDEYSGKRGMLPLSEISLKWIRNIHDYVKVGQKVVLLVLNVNPQRGHIDLSLRRVTDAQRKEKLQDVKQKQRAVKLLEALADDLKLNKKEFLEKIGFKLEDDFGSIYKGLEAISVDRKVADKLDLDLKVKTRLVEVVEKSIKPPYVEIAGYVNLYSYEPDGVDDIKNALGRIMECKTDKYTLEVNYISAPVYRILIRAPEYKTAEKVLKESTDRGVEYIKAHHGLGEFYRDDPAKQQSPGK